MRLVDLEETTCLVKTKPWQAKKRLDETRTGDNSYLSADLCVLPIAKDEIGL